MISPSTVFHAQPCSGMPSSGSNRSIAWISPKYPTCTRSSYEKPRVAYRLAIARTSQEYSRMSLSRSGGEPTHPCDSCEISMLNHPDAGERKWMGLVVIEPSKAPVTRANRGNHGGARAAVDDHCVMRKTTGFHCRVRL